LLLLLILFLLAIVTYSPFPLTLFSPSLSPFLFFFDVSLLIPLTLLTLPYLTYSLICLPYLLNIFFFQSALYIVEHAWRRSG
jgi:hypothetical protein